jgi:hypothetical protein
MHYGPYLSPVLPHRHDPAERQTTEPKSSESIRDKSHSSILLSSEAYLQVYQSRIRHSPSSDSYNLASRLAMTALRTSFRTLAAASQLRRLPIVTPLAFSRAKSTSTNGPMRDVMTGEIIQTPDIDVSPSPRS